MRKNLLEYLSRDPFVPFRLILSSGRQYDIANPHAAALLKSEVFVVLPDGERWAHIPLLHITAIETLTNGRGKHGSRKKK